MELDFVTGKKILVAGGAGLLGLHLCEKLVALGADLSARYYHRVPPQNLAGYFKPFDFTRYEDCLVATQGMDHVIICAVQASGVAGMSQSPTATILPNLSIHAGLFEACWQNQVDSVVWVSSSTVYQEANYPIAEDQFDLNQPTYPLYQGVGWVYRYIEQLAKCYFEKNNLPIGVIRTTNIYGPYDHFDDQKSHVIPALIKRALAEEDPFVVWGNQDTVRDFIYVEDLAEAVLRVMEGHTNAVPINFSYGEAITIGQLVPAILAACDHKAEIHYDASKPTAVPYRVLDNGKFQSRLGKVEKTDLGQGLAKTVAWYKSNLARD